jgi:hypothetical protein
VGKKKGRSPLDEDYALERVTGEASRNPYGRTNCSQLAFPRAFSPARILHSSLLLLADSVFTHAIVQSQIFRNVHLFIRHLVPKSKENQKKFTNNANNHQ